MTREEAIDVLKKTLAYESDFAEAKRMAIDALQTDVVRCGDCEHWNSETKGCKRNPSVEAWYETDSCSYGERGGE